MKQHAGGLVGNKLVFVIVFLTITITGMVTFWLGASSRVDNDKRALIQRVDSLLFEAKQISDSLTAHLTERCSDETVRMLTKQIHRYPHIGGIFLLQDSQVYCSSGMAKPELSNLTAGENGNRLFLVDETPAFRGEPVLAYVTVRGNNAIVVTISTYWFKSLLADSRLLVNVNGNILSDDKLISTNSIDFQNSAWQQSNMFDYQVMEYPEHTGIASVLNFIFILFLSAAIAVPAAFLFNYTLQRIAMSRYIQLRRGLRKQQFVPYYEPVMNRASGALYGAEVVMRWKKGNDTSVINEEIISLANKTGMISPLVNFILRQVEKDILSLRLRLPRTFYINFRLSESMIAMPELIDSFVEFQKRLPSDVKLTLEFPEVVYRDTTLEFDSVLRRLRVEGIKIKMSSLFLERLNADRNLYLPVDAVRIEKSITGLISDSKEPVASVDDIIRSAVNKNYTIIADGIENDQQYHYLSLRGVVLQQGNYWSMPLSSFHLMQYIIQSDKVLLC